MLHLYDDPSPKRQIYKSAYIFAMAIWGPNAKISSYTVVTIAH